MSMIVRYCCNVLGFHMSWALPAMTLSLCCRLELGRSALAFGFSDRMGLELIDDSQMFTLVHCDPFSRSSMANLILMPRAHFCLQHLRTNMLANTSRLVTPFHQQLRGKKKVARAPSTIKVKLLEDIKCYGRHGKLLPLCLYER